MNKAFLRYVFLITAFIFSYSLTQTLSAQELIELNDTLSFSYNDYYNYSQLYGELRYSPFDSVSSLKLSAKTNATYYPESFKSNSDVNLRYLRRFGAYQTGLRFNGSFNNDRLVAMPASGNIQIIPEIGYLADDWQAAGGAGYTARKDQQDPSEGCKLLFEGLIGTNSFQNPGSNLRIRAEQDNLDSNSNYAVNADGLYLDNWNDVYLTTEAGTSLQAYHQQLTEQQTLIERQSYRLLTTMDYQLTEQTGSRFTIHFEQKKKSSPNLTAIGKNQAVMFGLSEQMNYTAGFYSGSWKLSYNNNSENFVYSDKDDTYNNYSYQFNTENTLIYDKFDFTLNGRYYKSGLEGKRQNGLISQEDRDVMQAVLTPAVSWQSDFGLKLYQAVPLEYYHLVNISKSRSAANHTDRMLSSVSGWQYFWPAGWQNKGNISLKSTYQVYDYSDQIAGINSYIIKENSFSDSLEWLPNDQLLFSLVFRLSYDEFGYLNWGKFTEQPINHNYGYLGIIGCTLIDERLHKLRLEYLYFESDKFLYDQEIAGKSYLTAVYIQYGPRATGNYEYKKISTELQSAYYFYREKRHEFTFGLKIGYKI